MPKRTPSLAPGQEIKFKKPEYNFVKYMNAGGCGVTVLLHDPVIDERFVCKKFHPEIIQSKESLFPRFLNEIKILYQTNHPNIVRVFSYHVYPNETTGYYLMEQVEGLDILNFVQNNAKTIDDIFQQTIEGFAYLEQQGILHRDIRPNNILVNDQLQVKIIDFGFGKNINTNISSSNSTSPTPWCDEPDEFDDYQYDHTTEVYFVGRLFERILTEAQIDNFRYSSLVHKMTQKKPQSRIQTFKDILQLILTDSYESIDFTKEEKEVYQNFSKMFFSHITQIEINSKYVSDADEVINSLEQIYRNCILEEQIHDISILLKAVINGRFKYNVDIWYQSTDPLADFINLLKSVSPEKQRIIFANFYNKLDSVPRYNKQLEEVPF